MLTCGLWVSSSTLFPHGLRVVVVSWLTDHWYRFDGKSVPLVLSHKPVAAYDGALPTAEIEGGKIYTGSCHCGAIQLALKSKPLDSTFPEGFLQGVGECNCSICMRVRRLNHLYPHSGRPPPCADRYQ